MKSLQKFLLHAIDCREFKNTRKRYSFEQLTIVCFALLSSLSVPVTGHATNLASMSAQIKTQLHGHVTGYAYVIENDTQTIEESGGYALRAIDSPTGHAIPMTPTTRSFIASVTKTISAIATLQLLDKNGLSIDSPIDPWLPADWVRGPNIKLVTFKDLLHHRTGFKQIFDDLKKGEKANWGNDYDGLKWIVEKGSIPDAGKAYKNANLALTRVLIPALINGHQAPAPQPFQVSFANGIIFADYVRQAILEPSGVSPGVSCSADDYYQVQAMGYDVNDISEAGHMSETSIANCGGHAGLRMSASDLNNVMAALQKGSLLSEKMFDDMHSYNLGWSFFSNTTFFYGNIGKWWHGGAWNSGGGRGYRACVMTFSDGIRASVVINSRTTGTDICTIVKAAYDNAELWLGFANPQPGNKPTDTETVLSATN